MEEAGQFRFSSAGPGETQEIAAIFARQLGGGEIVTLRGVLGAGKTLFAAAMIRALGVTEPVLSPTYVLQRSYRTPEGLTIHHMDFYRLAGTDDLEALGVDELIGDDAIVIVEWPERCPGAFDEVTARITLDVTSEEGRAITIRPGELPFDRNGFARQTSELKPEPNEPQEFREP